MSTPPAVMLSKYGLAPSRQRGQNFLSDENVVRKVVRAVAAGPDDVVVEIGPGFGALTFGLAETARHVVAVEFDDGIAGAFRAEYGDPEGVTLVKGDILDFDFRAAARDHDAARVIVAGNIPYNITSPLVRRLIEVKSVVSRVVLMIQSEVCDRIAAGPGEREYSGLSVVTRYHAHVRRLFTVRRTCFHPRPRVDSGVVEMVFGDVEARRSDPDAFLSAVQAAFGKRRKMLRQSLLPLLKDAGLTASQLGEASGVDMSRRGESLSVEEFDVLAHALGSAAPGPACLPEAGDPTNDGR